MDLYNETKLILKQANLSANKSLGQNFLINENVVDEIIEKSDISDKDLIIEIGPGLGTLTKRLLEKAYKVMAVELDNNMVEILKNRFKSIDNLTIINEDILKVDIEKIINDEKEKALKNDIKINRVKVIANLPYYISTPIVLKLLEQRLNINEIIIMVQKEVADRICANPGTKLSGSITYMVNYYAESEKLLNVSANSFLPNPKVESEVIKLLIRDKLNLEIKDEKKFFHLVQTIFSQRRKKLINVLVNMKIVDNKEKAGALLEKIGLDENSRAENLSLEKFIELNNILEN